MAPPAHDSFNERYKVIEKIGEGSYSEVLKCKKRDSGDIYACKRLKHNYRGWSEVNEIAEIRSLRQLIRHPNILQMTEVHFDPSMGRVCLVFEIMDKNLYELIKDRKRLLSESRVKVMMFQLVRALRHLHKHGIFHRDVKPENILLKKNDMLKLGDLGSVRGLFSKPPYTEYISTRWYRSPECLLTAGHYGFKMDIWAAGCVFYEILTLRPLFPGSSELDQINRIHNILGPPHPRILQKFCNQVKEDALGRDYSMSSSKKARFEAIRKVLDGFNPDHHSSKSRNFDWYFTPSKDPGGVERLLPSHISQEAREMLKSLLQYDPDSRPSSHRVIQHHYFNDLRQKAGALVAKESVEDDGVRPLVTIVGDPQATAHAMAEADRADLGRIGDNKMKAKLRRMEDAKKGSTKAEPAPPVNKGATQTVMTVHTGAPKRIDKSNIPKKIQAAEEILKAKKALLQPSSFVKDSSRLMTEKMTNLKYKYPPIEKLHEDAKSRDADVDTPISSKKEKSGPASSFKSTVAEAKANRKALNAHDQARHSETISSERSTQVSEISKMEEFPRAFIDKSKLNASRLQRINENRAMVQLEPIGGIKRSVLASDLSPSSYFKRAIAVAGKEVVNTKQIQNVIRGQRTTRERDPPQKEQIAPKAKKVENFVSLKNSHATSDIPPISKSNLPETHRRRIANSQVKSVIPESYYASQKTSRNSQIPVKSDLAALPRLSVQQKVTGNWQDHDFLPIRKEHVPSKIPLLEKKERSAIRSTLFDEEVPIYESHYYKQKPNPTVTVDKNPSKEKYARPANYDDASSTSTRRRPRNEMTYISKPSGIPNSKFIVANEEHEGRPVDIAALLAQQRRQREILAEKRAAAQSNSYQQNKNLPPKRTEGYNQIHQAPVYYPKEAQLLQMANTYQRRINNAPTGDQPLSFIESLEDRKKERQLASLAPLKSNIERIQHLDVVDESPRPAPGPRRLKPTIPRCLPESPSPRETYHQSRDELSHARSVEIHRSSQNTNFQLRRENHLTKDKLRAARNDDVFFSSDDDALNLMREKVGSIISERASQRASLLQQQKNPRNVESDEDAQDLRFRLQPGKRMRREARLRDYD